MLKKWTTLAALVLATALILTGCVQGGDVADPNAEPTATLAPLTEPMYTDREALYQYYNAVTFGETLNSAASSIPISRMCSARTTRTTPS